MKHSFLFAFYALIMAACGPKGAYTIPGQGSFDALKYTTTADSTVLFAKEGLHFAKGEASVPVIRLRPVRRQVPGKCPLLRGNPHVGF